MKLFKWLSQSQLTVQRGGKPTVAYSVAKYNDGVRKQAALLKKEGSTIRAVAYFRSEDDAKGFAKDILDGIQDS